MMNKEDSEAKDEEGEDGQCSSSFFGSIYE